MKILSTPISVLAHFKTDGTPYPHPLRLKLNGDTIQGRTRRLSKIGRCPRSLDKRVG